MNALRSFKTCNRCGLVKTALSFQVDRSMSDGLRGRCSECEKQIQAERRAAAKRVTVDPVAEAFRRWCKSWNPDTVRARFAP